MAPAPRNMCVAKNSNVQIVFHGIFAMIAGFGIMIE